MNNRLSHSAINKFLFCGEAFRLHYREGYRPLTTSSALVFGKALDKAFEYILTGKNDISGTNIANEYEYFDYYWRNQYINDVPTDIYSNPNNVISYSSNDIDYDLLTKEEISMSEGISDRIAWFSMRHKGHLMIDTFKTDFLPKEKKLYLHKNLLSWRMSRGISLLVIAMLLWS